ncbi:flagellin [Pelagimonas varians]|uniref:Flagellin n=1 Tax=Pelagimonas varians TaxID=696760 RepID=A0A238KIU8_9RHOB|nr:flagellin [Pelagimonas varians]PYG29607.1 flagellin [Pelagimonas varians]SMX42627.1 Flagellin [Pelagimonas varians]
MSSILTNNGAMVALQTLKSINSNMADTQSKISTGKAVANAKDNSAVWAISKVMEADVKGFAGISDSLNLGQSTVAVARQASETVTDLLTDIKGKIVAAQEENVDRDKIQTDITALRDQIGAVVGAAQFNGLNLLANTDTTAGTGSINVLASLDRSADGVAASDINVGKQDLGSGAATAGTMGTDIGDNNAVADGTTGAALALTGTPAAGMSYQLASAGGMGFSADVTYVAREGDTLQDVTDHMVARLNVQAAEDGIDVSFAENATTAGQIDFTNNTGAGITVATADASQAASSAENDGTVGGGLELLSGFDVSTDAGTEAALAGIESLIQTAVDSAANFGSVQGRIETQSEFVSGLSDALKSGIGSMVDADMEETSARLQALQVQQQLGVQALSIANQAPQQLLSLFR